MGFFIKKPVASIVICLLILVIGLVCLSDLQVREFPTLKISTITIKTLYPGATPKIVQSFVTEPIEGAVSSADGIDHIVSSSSQGVSSITVFLRLNENPEKSLIDVSSKVSAIRFSLPQGVQDPSISKMTGVTFPAYIMSFTSETMNAQEISAYLAKVIKPELQNTSGVAFINVFGNKPYAMRIWLDPIKMIAHNISANDVYKALSTSNVLSSAGELKDTLNKTQVSVSTNIDEAEQFDNVVLRRGNDSKVKLKDIANVAIGAQDYNSELIFNGKKAVNLAFILQPGANPITVINEIKKKLPSIRKSLPHGLNMESVYDSTIYIKQSLSEVKRSLFEAIIIVIFVVFLFLGSFSIV